MQTALSILSIINNKHTQDGWVVLKTEGHFSTLFLVSSEPWDTDPSVFAPPTCPKITGMFAKYADSGTLSWEKP